MRLTFAEVRIDLADIRKVDRAFRFYASVMDVQAECKRLWAYLRWLDRAGSGCAAIDVSIAARFLKCSRATIYRMLAAGLTPTPTVPRKGDQRPSVVGAPLQWFRDRVSCGGGVIRIWYASAVIVCEGLGLYSPGAISDVPIDSLSRVGAKITATELTALHRQHQTYFAARVAKGNRHYTIIFNCFERVPPTEKEDSFINEDVFRCYESPGKALNLFWLSTTSIVQFYQSVQSTERARMIDMATQLARAVYAGCLIGSSDNVAQMTARFKKTSHLEVSQQNKIATECLSFICSKRQAPILEALACHSVLSEFLTYPANVAEICAGADGRKGWKWISRVGCNIYLTLMEIPWASEFARLEADQKGPIDS
jgi:hypothetical protein